MNDKILPIGFVVSIFLNIIASVFKIEHLPGSKSLVILGLLSYGVLAILCLYEIVNSKKVKRSEKFMWFVGFLCGFPVAALIYMLSARNRIISSN